MQTFTKKERLCSKKLIEALFKNASSFVVFPFRLMWVKTTLQSKFPAQVVISVPKKKIPRAIDRNRIRRQTREAYRKKKDILYDFLQNKKIQCAVMLMYIGKTSCTYHEIEAKTEMILHCFAEDYEKNSK